MQWGTTHREIAGKRGADYVEENFLSARIVYLDTQDYSRLSDALNGRGDEALIPVFRRLLQFEREGAFTFAFSYMIAAESLRLNPDDIGIARRKAEVMEDLCGGQAFPSIFWVLSSELASAAQKRGIGSERKLQSLEEVVFGGQWIRTELPSIETMFPTPDGEFERLREAEFIKRVGRKPNRAERRRIDKPIALADARRIVADAQIYPIIQDTPLFDKFANGFRHRRIHEISGAFFQFLALPTRLIMSYDHLHSMGFLNDQVSSLKSAFFEAFSRLRDEFDQLRTTSGQKFGRTERAKMLSPVLRDHLIEMTGKLKDHLIRYGAPAAYFDHPDFTNDISSLPILTAWHDLLMPYMMMVTDEAPSRRALDPSDVIDFMHSLYMPYCAVWRSDRYFAALATPVARRLGCRVVSKLVDLPRVLEELSEEHQRYLR